MGPRTGETTETIFFRCTHRIFLKISSRRHPASDYKASHKEPHQQPTDMNTQANSGLPKCLLKRAPPPSPAWTIRDDGSRCPERVSSFGTMFICAQSYFLNTSRRPVRKRSIVDSLIQILHTSTIAQ